MCVIPISDHHLQKTQKALSQEPRVPKTNLEERAGFRYQTSYLFSGSGLLQGQFHSSQKSSSPQMLHLHETATWITEFTEKCPLLREPLSPEN